MNEIARFVFCFGPFIALTNICETCLDEGLWKEDDFKYVSCGPHPQGAYTP